MCSTIGKHSADLNDLQTVQFKSYLQRKIESSILMSYIVELALILSLFFKLKNRGDNIIYVPINSC